MHFSRSGEVEVGGRAWRWDVSISDGSVVVGSPPRTLSEVASAHSYAIRDGWRIDVRLSVLAVDQGRPTERGRTDPDVAWLRESGDAGHLGTVWLVGRFGAEGVEPGSPFWDPAIDEDFEYVVDGQVFFGQCSVDDVSGATIVVFLDDAFA